MSKDLFGTGVEVPSRNLFSQFRSPVLGVLGSSRVHNFTRIMRCVGYPWYSVILMECRRTRDWRPRSWGDVWWSVPLRI